MLICRRILYFLTKELSGILETPASNGRGRQHASRCLFPQRGDHVRADIEDRLSEFDWGFIQIAGGPSFLGKFPRSPLWQSGAAGDKELIAAPK